MSSLRPQQARSQKTLEKILDACDRLLVDRTFDQITMQALAKEAGVSVGNLYNRFEDRGALIAQVAERHQRRFLEGFLDAFENGPRPESLRERLALLARHFQTGIAELRFVFVLLANRGPNEGDASHGSFSRTGTDRILDVAVDWLQPKEGEPEPTLDHDLARKCVASMAIQLQYDLIFSTASRLMGESLSDFLAEQACNHLAANGQKTGGSK